MASDDVQRGACYVLDNPTFDRFLATKIRAAIRSMVAVYCCRIEPFLPALRILAAQRFLLQHLREVTPRGADGGGCNDKGQM